MAVVIRYVWDMKYNKLKAQIELLEAIALAEEDERKGRMGPIEDTFISIEQLLAEAE